MNPLHLLEQAERLAQQGKGRPRQADLRRAISTAYYAIFHLLTQAGGKLVTRHASLQATIARKYGHKEMKEASRLFSEGKVPQSLTGVLSIVPGDIVLIAITLIETQTKRQQADYNLSSTASFNRRDVIEILAEVRQAFAAFDRIRNEPAAELYLLAMLFQPLGR